MKVEHLKKNGKKAEISLSDFYHSFIILERKGNHRLCIKCNWANNHNKLTNFEINITDKNYDERYIVTRPLFYLIFNLVQFFGIFNTSIESKGDVCPEFKNSIYELINQLNNSMVYFNVMTDSYCDYEKYKSRVNSAMKNRYCIFEIINNFFNYDMQLNDVIKKLEELSCKLHETYNVIKVFS